LDPIKVLIFVGAILALLVLGRMLSSSSEVHAASLPRPASPAGPGDEDTNRSQVPLTGAEFGFPFRVPPVTQLEDGTYSRPNLVDYYFSKTDLVRGPAEPDSFLDELCVKAQDPASGYTWDCHFTVATPTGIRQVMDQERFASLYLNGGVVIVPRWDLSEILHTAVDEIIKAYSSQQLDELEGGSGESGRRLG
jgi:hypothetical protein